jgi:hypothetical protein
VRRGTKHVALIGMIPYHHALGTMHMHVVLDVILPVLEALLIDQAAVVGVWRHHEAKSGQGGQPLASAAAASFGWERSLGHLEDERL